MCGATRERKTCLTRLRPRVSAARGTNVANQRGLPRVQVTATAGAKAPPRARNPLMGGASAPGLSPPPAVLADAPTTSPTAATMVAGSAAPVGLLLIARTRLAVGAANCTQLHRHFRVPGPAHCYPRSRAQSSIPRALRSAMRPGPRHEFAATAVLRNPRNGC